MACETCGGTGWRIVTTAEGSHAERCACFATRDARRALTRSGIPARYEHCELEGSFEVHHPSHERALKISRRFVEAFPVVEGGLLYTGPCGVGKTHLAAAVTRELVLSKGVDARFVDFRELLKEIQASYNPVAGTSEKEVLRPVLDCELLVLDDLGAEKPSAWVRDTIAYILNDRYKRERVVVITTNLRDEPEPTPPAARLAGRAARSRVERDATTASELLVDRIGAPARSRLYEMCKVVELGGSDYRTLKSHGVDSSYR